MDCKDISLSAQLDRMYRSQGKLDLTLLPAPYGGNLRNADVVILFLNPGLSIVDHYAEGWHKAYVRAHWRAIRQEPSDNIFLWLNTQFCWHGGFQYWEGKLRRTVEVIASKKYERSYQEALKSVAQRLAVVQLLPYHSQNFSSHKLITQLPSCDAAKKYARGELAPAAKRKEKTIIVLRRADDWGLERSANVAIYDTGHRAAGLGPDTLGGRAILRCFGL